MSSLAKKPIVWGVFVGFNGDQLEILNSINGPFPPPVGAEGYIAIGWPAIGDMRMFNTKSSQGSYLDFVEKFRLIYPPENKHQEAAERVFKTKANMPWYFAFEMVKEQEDRPGDWIISPCATHGLVLVGVVIGDYETDFHNDLGFYGKRWADLVHFRKIRWEFVVKKTDPSYKQINRIGQLTISKQSLTVENLKEILENSK